jgi:hypothetical protein
MVETWRKGELNSLLFLQNKEEKSERIKQTLVLKKK